MVTTSSPIILSSWLFVLIWLIISILTSVTTATLTLATVIIIFIVITFYFYLASHFTSSSASQSTSSEEVTTGGRDGDSKVKRASVEADDSSIQSRASSSTAKGTCKNVNISRSTSRRKSSSTCNRRKSSSCSSTYPIEDEILDENVNNNELDDVELSDSRSYRIRRANHYHQQQHLYHQRHQQQQQHRRHQVKSRGEDGRLRSSRRQVEGDDKVPRDDVRSGDNRKDEYERKERQREDDVDGDEEEEEEEEEEERDEEDTIASRDDLIKRMVRSSRLSAYYKLKQHRQSMAAYGSGTGFNSYYNQSPYYYTSQQQQQQQHAHLQQHQHQVTPLQQYSHWHTGQHQSMLNYPSYNSRYYNTHYYNSHFNQPENHYLHHSHAHQQQQQQQQAVASYYNPNESKMSSSRSSSASAGVSATASYYSRDHASLPRASSSSLYNYNQKNRHLDHYRLQQQQLQHYYQQDQLKASEYSRMHFPYATEQYLSDSHDVRTRGNCSTLHGGYIGDVDSSARATGDGSPVTSVTSLSNMSKSSRRVSSASSPPSLPMKYTQVSLNNYTNVPSGASNRYNRLRSSVGKLTSTSGEQQPQQINTHRSSSSCSNIVGRSKSPAIVEEEDTASSTASPSSILNSPGATDSTLTQSSSPSTVTQEKAEKKSENIINEPNKIIVDTSTTECTIVPPNIPPRPRTLPSQLKSIPDTIDEVIYTQVKSSINKSDHLQYYSPSNDEVSSDINSMDHVFNVKTDESASDTLSKLAESQLYGESIVSSNDVSDSSTICKNKHQTVDLTGEQCSQQDDDDRTGAASSASIITVNQIRRGPWSLSTDSAEIRIRKSRASLRRSNALTVPHTTDDITVDRIQRMGKNNSTESAVSSTDPTDSCDSIHHQSSEEIYDLPVNTILSGVNAGASSSRIRPSFRKSTSLLKQAHLQNSSSFERDCSEGYSDAGTSVSRSLSRQTTFSSITKDNDRISARTGYLEISHTYDPPTKKLIITIIETTELTLYPVRGLSGSISLGTGIDLSASNVLDSKRGTVAPSTSSSSTAAVAVSAATNTTGAGGGGGARRTPSPLTASSSATGITGKASGIRTLIASSNTLTPGSIVTAPNSLLTGYKLKKSMSASAGGQSAPLIFVRMALLPLKRNKVKTKSKCISFDGTVRFNEEFTFTRINPEEMIRMGCRFRVYLTEGKMKRQSLIGEANLPFVSAKPLQHETKSKLPLLSTRSSFLVSRLLFFSSLLVSMSQERDRETVASKWRAQRCVKCAGRGKV